jgi:hypothetical protein
MENHQIGIPGSDFDDEGIAAVKTGNGFFQGFTDGQPRELICFHSVDNPDFDTGLKHDTVNEHLTIFGFPECAGADGHNPSDTVRGHEFLETLENFNGSVHGLPFDEAIAKDILAQCQGLLGTVQEVPITFSLGLGY